MAEADAMTDRNDIRRPLDHLPPVEERDPGDEIEEPHYPDTGTPAGDSPVSPATAAPIGDVDRHDVDTMPPS